MRSLGSVVVACAVALLNVPLSLCQICPECPQCKMLDCILYTRDCGCAKQAVNMCDSSLQMAITFVMTVGGGLLCILLYMGVLVCVYNTKHARAMKKRRAKRRELIRQGVVEPTAVDEYLGLAKTNQSKTYAPKQTTGVHSETFLDHEPKSKTAKSRH